MFQKKYDDLVGVMRLSLPKDDWSSIFVLLIIQTSYNLYILALLSFV